MSYTIQDDGRYHIPIVDIGTRLRDNFGLSIKEHSAFDEVDRVHAPNSYHYYDEAIDIQDWRGGEGAGDEGFDGVGYVERTGNLENLLQGSGAEVIGPNSGVSGHGTHLHLAGKDGIIKLDENQYSHLFGGGAGGTSATFARITPPASGEQPDSQPIDVPDTQPPTQTPQQNAVERVQNYAKMSKADMNSAYDKMRSEDPNKASIEGMKMHKAFFGK